MYYAGYDNINTDIAVFVTKEERDTWVNGETNFIRTPFTKEEAEELIGSSVDTYKGVIEDYMYKSIVCWLINPLNIIH